jgi:hypothetical protein
MAATKGSNEESSSQYIGIGIDRTQQQPQASCNSGGGGVGWGVQCNAQLATVIQPPRSGKK